MGTVRIITRTTVENTLKVDESLIAGMTAKQIAALMRRDPEVFGVDDDPYIDPDVLAEIMDEHGEVLFTDSVEDLGNILIPK